MRNQRLGCLTASGILSTLITSIVIVTFLVLRGNAMFSPGALNAQAGEETLGGVTSHAQAACHDCHSAPWDSSRMADRCTACHIDVAVDMVNVASLHGTITHHNPDLLCGHCHPDHRGPEASLTIATAADFPHEAVGYSLKGHQRKASGDVFVCQDCHPQSITAFELSICQTCHQQSDAAFMQTHVVNYGTDCLACHDGVDRFGKTFEHDAFPFKLEGKHASVECGQCHANAHTLADFPAAPKDCFSCHQKNDSHQGQFGSDCGACHSPKGWKPANFDHNLSAFKLEGKHAKVECQECHKNGVFKGTPTDCYSCHAQKDEHSGQFGTDCGACHTPNAWDQVTFDHSKSAFPLEGAHANVQCEQCHKNKQFAGTPTACANCHEDPAFHRGLFGTDCASCHSVNAWSPAQYNRPHAFPLNHGERGSVSCATCHPNNFATYTCYGCHEHSEPEITAKHLEEGISNFQNCVECHPTGRGGD